MLVLLTLDYTSRTLRMETQKALNRACSFIYVATCMKNAHQRISLLLNPLKHEKRQKAAWWQRTLQARLRA